MLDIITAVIQALNRVVWGAPALLLILGVGLYFSFRTRFLQVRKLGFSLSTIWRKLREKPEPGGVSPFQAVCTALGATVGTGNIAGGGRGHCHWWTRRNFLDVGCRPTGYGGEVCGGGPGGSLSGTGWAGRVSGWPDVLHQTWFGPQVGLAGGLFCVFGMVGAFGVGNSTQISTAVTSVNEAPPLSGLHPFLPRQPDDGSPCRWSGGPGGPGGCKTDWSRGRVSHPCDVCGIHSAQPGGFGAQRQRRPHSPAIHFRRRLLPQSIHRWRRRDGLSDPAHWSLPRGVYQRSRYGHRLHCPCRGQHPPPRRAGAIRHL